MKLNELDLKGIVEQANSNSKKLFDLSVSISNDLDSIARTYIDKVLEPWRADCADDEYLTGLDRLGMCTEIYEDLHRANRDLVELYKYAEMYRNLVINVIRSLINEENK